ncbi:hypothetical protein [uncultured Pontibacter sp.]|nr:hypothetical protein [uncultured Pontibacter sp.]
MKKCTYAILAILLITLSSCSEMTGEFKYMNQLKETISKTYETEKVEIDIKNKSELTVSLLDSKFDHYSQAEKE